MHSCKTKLGRGHAALVPRAEIIAKGKKNVVFLVRTIDYKESKHKAHYQLSECMDMDENMIFY